MSRSIWKGPFSLKQLFTVDLQTVNQNSPLYVWSRNSMVLPEYIGKTVQIYNGKSWARRKIVENMVGHKFGEFSYTRKKTIHKTNRVKQVTPKKKV